MADKVAAPAEDKVAAPVDRVAAVKAALVEEGVWAGECGQGFCPGGMNRLPVGYNGCT